MIAIIDYGLGNIGSIQNMLQKIGVASIVTSNENEIMLATKVILPGVGAFDAGMRGLKEKGLIDVLIQKAIIERVPFLGICLGAQLMTHSSQEGILPGLGWLDATTVKFNFDSSKKNLPLPNIGWRDVISARSTPLLADFNETPRFYFVHTYHFMPKSIELISMCTTYGYEFAAGLWQGNIHCVQFHPEKSHRFGMKMLINFARLT